ncbi:hypothetical protein [Bdellovibrio reynosensis]|uniref:Uncharacterized protein n=1 Tax=Bdellovibrio reynosensis TaxID=2835041 RepID=A0ABY4C801_9BACT|nr:hypothetical protein [Bdellovibrio reynosensis]UOF00599.1 hypothetical protein MNR06_12915 [Bdellovibrio reynosensis]
MNALLRKKKEWEFQNERYLLKLVETSADMSIESVKKAGLLTSFLVYLVYKILGGMLAIASAMFRGPLLVRYSAPEKMYEQVELSTYQLESRIRNPFMQG